MSSKEGQRLQTSNSIKVYTYVYNDFVESIVKARERNLLPQLGNETK